jgi:anti-anti-sigma regulatory factor
MKLKISNFFLIFNFLLIESASLSSEQHQSLSQAVLEIIGSLDEGDAASAKLSVIKVTSLEADDIVIDLFIEVIVRGFGGVLEIHDEPTPTRNHALIIATSALSIEKFLRSFRFDPQNKLIVTIVASSPSAAAVKRMLDVMWRKFILNVHVVTREGNGDVALSTYFPFGEDFCGQVHPVVWNIYRKGAFVEQRDHFPRKTDDFHRCQLSVAVFNAAPYMVLNGSDVEGVDGNVLKTLARELNFSINYVYVSDDERWGEIHANRSATGALELVSCDDKLFGWV